MEDEGTMLLVGGGCLALHQRGRAAWEGISGSGWGPKGLWALSVTVRDSQAQACNQQQEPPSPSLVLWDPANHGRGANQPDNSAVGSRGWGRRKKRKKDGEMEDNDRERRREGTLGEKRERREQKEKDRQILRDRAPYMPGGAGGGWEGPGGEPGKGERGSVGKKDRRQGDLGQVGLQWGREDRE